MPTDARALFHNWRLKGSALGLAIFLWALVQTEPRSEETFSAVPVRVLIADTTWTLSEQPSPTSVELRLDGPAREIIRLAREGTAIHIPVPTVGSRDTIVTIRRDWVELGQRAGLVVESVSPTTVRLQFERAETRLVPVSMRIQGRVRDNMALATDITVSPALLRVRGPSSRVAALDSIALQTFDLARVNGSGVYTVGVDTTGLSGALVTPATATLSVRVEDLAERVLESVSVDARAAPGQPEVVIDPGSVRLTLSGARTVVMSLDTSLLRVWVPSEFLEDMAPGERRRVRLQVEGVPKLVTAVLGSEYVTVQRAVDVRGDRPAP